MATTAELVRAYRAQADWDADEAIAMLVDFFAAYGMTDGAAEVLCEYIDDEGMTGDFAGMLKESGLVLDPGGASDDGDDADEE